MSFEFWLECFSATPFARPYLLMKFNPIILSQLGFNLLSHLLNIKHYKQEQIFS